jgi:DNA-directed RNA polymerase subunit alpha
MNAIKTSPYIPTEFVIESQSDRHVQISAYPFQSGYAITLAHPLRRLLLSSTVGFSPIAIKIEGASHEFDNIRGMLEDVALMIVNLKNIRFKLKNGLNSATIDYSFSGPATICGADLINGDVDVVTPDGHLCILNEDAHLNFSIIIQKGIGYTPSESIRDNIPDGYIPLDAYFTPVRKAVYDIQNVLVEDDPTYEKIVFDITTDGQTTPMEAFRNALSVMYAQLSVFNGELDLTLDASSKKDDDSSEIKILTQKVESLNLSARSFNCLDRSSIKYVGQLALMSENELKEIKNLGKKSFEEIRDKLEELGFPVSKGLSEEIEKALRKKLEKL